MKHRPKKFQSITFFVIAALMMFGFMTLLGIQKSTESILSCGSIITTSTEGEGVFVTEKNKEEKNRPTIQQQEEDEDSCSIRLDELDRTFNKRRQIRIDHVEQRMKQIPPTIRHGFDMFEPESICITEERFGSIIRYDAFGDGPKFVCGLDYLRETTTTTKTTTIMADDIHDTNNNNNSCLVYSVGSNNDISFEQSVFTFLPGCEIHTFDPTLRKSFIGDEYSQFHPWGLGKDNVTLSFKGKTFVTKSFDTIRKELGHIGRPINILKIDCEGCEYTVMEPLFDAIERNDDDIQVDQILIEMHNEPKWNDELDVRWKRIVNWFEAADRAKMRIYHKERNHWGCQGAFCVEYALASEDFLRRSNGQIVCGTTTTTTTTGNQQQ